MNNTILPFNCNKETKSLEEIRYVAEGIGYIKSRKADFRVMDMAEDMIQFAAHNHKVAISDVIVDDSSAIDVDRKSVDHLVAEMERDDITALFVRNITDITRDSLDLIKFMSIAKENGVLIFDISRGCMVGIEPPADFGC